MKERIDEWYQQNPSQAGTGSSNATGQLMLAVSSPSTLATPSEIPSFQLSVPPVSATIVTPEVDDRIAALQAEIFELRSHKLRTAAPPRPRHTTRQSKVVPPSADTS